MIVTLNAQTDYRNLQISVSSMVYYLLFFQTYNTYIFVTESVLYSRAITEINIKRYDGPNLLELIVFRKRQTLFNNSTTQ